MEPVIYTLEKGPNAGQERLALPAGIVDGVEYLVVIVNPTDKLGANGIMQARRYAQGHAPATGSDDPPAQPSGGSDPAGEASGLDPGDQNPPPDTYGGDEGESGGDGGGSGDEDRG